MGITFQPELSVGDVIAGGGDGGRRSRRLV